jgi:hypothetical protein
MSSRTITSMVLAFLFPGAGHLFLGKRARAAVFAVVVMAMFLIGLWLDGKIYVAEPGKPLTLLAMLASIGTGIPYFVARAMGPLGEITSITYEYGTAFTLTAGLMNLLLVLDAFDIAEERKS